MWVHHLTPVFLTLGPLEIRYYGILYALGFLFTYFFVKRFNAQKKLLRPEHLDSFFFWLVIGVVGGARVFEVLFYHPDYYVFNPLEILAIWHGGLSFHGGLAGAILVTFFFCRRHQYSFFRIADILVIPGAFALFLGRIGNFINGELYGKLTTLPWGVQFPGADGFRHPTQLYEALKNLALFGFLWSFSKKNLKEGLLFAYFLIGYSTLRFFIEFLKEPETMFGLLTMGQALSLVTLVLGLLLLRRKSSQKK